MNNILILSQEFPPDVGGAGVVAKNLAKYLAKHKYTVDVLTTAKIVSEKKIDDGYRLDCVKKIPKLFPLSLWQKLRNYDLDKYQIIILNDIGACVVATLFFNNKLKNKCIVYLHGSELKIFKKQKSTFKLLNFQKKYIKLLQDCYGIIAVSKYMRERFLSISGLNEIEEKITVIHNTVDQDIFYPEIMDLYDLCDISQECELIFSAGRIIAGKGYGEQYQLFKRLIHQSKQYHWIIAGDGDYLPKLKEMICNDGMKDHISFVGRLTQSEMRKYYSSVDVFWQLSKREEESFGLVYLEANACGTPVVALKKAGAVEAVKDQISGFLVEDIEECLMIFKHKAYKNIDKSLLNRHIEEFQNKRREILKVLEIALLEMR